MLARSGAIPDIATAIDRYHDGFRDIRAGQGILPDSQRPAYNASLRLWKEKGVSDELGGPGGAVGFEDDGSAFYDIFEPDARD